LVIETKRLLTFMNSIYIVCAE